MFRLSNKHFLIVCIIVLDFLLIADIMQKNRPQVLGVSSKNVRNVKVTPTKKPAKIYFRPFVPKITATPTPTVVKLSPSPIKQESTSDLLTQINSFRSGKGLAPLVANSETCFFANMRVQEIQSSFNHDGFTNRINSKSLPYPSYSEVAENIAMNPNPSEVINGWINSPGHNENMSKNVPFGCVVGANNYYVFEAWKP